MSSFNFAVCEVAMPAEELPSVLVKSILKRASATELNSRKKVVFQDEVRVETFCVEEGHLLISTKQANLEGKERRQKRKEKKEELAALDALMQSMVQDFMPEQLENMEEPC